jgi:hypothetical protein
MDVSVVATREKIAAILVKILEVDVSHDFFSLGPVYLQS